MNTMIMFALLVVLTGCQSSTGNQDDKANEKDKSDKTKSEELNNSLHVLINIVWLQSDKFLP